ncbi:MAG: pseudouridine synthase [Lachnospiraceae bacterium]|nr:pseudouridine synthase [Lachnospiraceae bacterium]
MRLDKFLCDNRIGSRKEVKAVIRSGRVSVGSSVVRSPDIKIDPEKEEVFVDCKQIIYEQFRYYMLNKPEGVISSTEGTSDNDCDMAGSEERLSVPGEAKTVIDLLKAENIKGLFPVGRLDKDTEGLLLITDDGALSHRLLSPKRHVDKTYEVHLKVHISDDDIKRLEEGVDIGDEKKTYPAVIERVHGTDEGVPVIYLTIHEGRFHQVKRMMEAVGNKVIYLKRISMGPIFLDEKLDPGKYRRLTDEEISKLRMV